MSPKLIAAFITILLLGIVVPVFFSETHAQTATPIVNRSFYLTSSNALSPFRPTSGPPSSANSSETPLEFGFPPVLQLYTVTVYTPMTLSLWLAVDNDTDVSLTGTLQERPITGSPIPVVNSTRQQRLTTGLNRYNFTFSVPSQAFVLYSQIFLLVRFSSLSANVTMFWGSEAYPSLMVLRLSGYDSLNSNRPLDILDSTHSPATTFDLNSTIPNNVVIFQANVISAFGFDDISRVNMTIVDRTGVPVRDARNIEMQATFACPPPPSQPCAFVASWIYPSNATEGTYQVHVDIVDVQNSTIFTFRGPATFGLFKASIFSRPPFNYLPYAGAGGVAILGAALVYRRRKTKKSYLAPFDYFNTLTNGELDGGTVVAVEGNTGAGKTLLSEQLMFEDLKKGRPCVFVATGDFPSNIRANMRTMGLDVSGYEQSGLLTFVDGYSAEAGQDSREKFSIPSLGDLTTLGVRISSSLPSTSFKGGSLYFDSLTPMASKTKPENIVSFVHTVGARVKGMDGKAFFTLGPSVDGNIQRQIEEMADCVVQMEAFEEGGVRKSRLRVVKYRARRYQQSWVLYSIEEGKGIIFYSKRPRQ